MAITDVVVHGRRDLVLGHWGERYRSLERDIRRYEHRMWVELGVREDVESGAGEAKYRILRQPTFRELELVNAAVRYEQAARMVAWDFRNCEKVDVSLVLRAQARHMGYVEQRMKMVKALGLLRGGDGEGEVVEDDAFSVLDEELEGTVRPREEE